MSESFVATVELVAFEFAPEGYAFCDGAKVAIAQNAALASLIRVFYGGDGTTYVNLPDLRSRVPIGMAVTQTPQMYSLGQTGGQETVELDELNMPGHTHSATFAFNSSGPGDTDTAMTIGLQAYTQGGSAETPVAGTYISGGAATMFEPAGGTGATVAMAGATGYVYSATISLGNSGGGIPVSIVNPFQAVNYIICTSGYYPVRQW